MQCWSTWLLRSSDTLFTCFRKILCMYLLPSKRFALSPTFQTISGTCQSFKLCVSETVIIQRVAEASVRSRVSSWPLPILLSATYTSRHVHWYIAYYHFVPFSRALIYYSLLNCSSTFASILCLISFLQVCPCQAMYCFRHGSRLSVSPLVGFLPDLFLFVYIA